MIQVATTTEQTIPAGQSVTFDAVVVKTCCSETHRTGSGIVTMTANCRNYKVEAHANVSSAEAGQVQLQITLDGEPLQNGLMYSTVTTAGSFNSVSSGIIVRNGQCCCSRVSVRNTGTTPVTVAAGATLLVYPIGGC